MDMFVIHSFVKDTYLFPYMPNIQLVYIKNISLLYTLGIKFYNLSKYNPAFRWKGRGSCFVRRADIIHVWGEAGVVLRRFGDGGRFPSRFLVLIIVYT